MCLSLCLHWNVCKMWKNAAPHLTLNVCDTETHICRYTECKTRKHFQYGADVAIHRSFSGLFSLGTTWATHEKYQPDSESLAEALLELRATYVSAVPLTRSLWPFNMGAEMKKQDIPSCTHVQLKPPVWDQLNVRIKLLRSEPRLSCARRVTVTQVSVSLWRFPIKLLLGNFFQTENLSIP